MKTLGTVLEEVEAMEPEIIQTFMEMVRVPALAPVNGGDGESRKADYLMTKTGGFDQVRRFDVPDKVNPDVMRSNIVAVKRGKRKGTLWFVSHIDVVPEGDLELWKTPPFEPDLRDGRIYGRGTEDDGQSVISTLFASRPFLDQEFGGMSLGIVWAADEETGSECGISYLLDQGVFQPGDVIIVPDHCSPDGGEVSVAEKHILWLKFCIEGKSVHAASPGLGINAYKVSTMLLMELIESFDSRFGDRDAMFCPSSSTFEPTKRIATVENVNTIPGYDEFCMDIRINPNYDPETVIRMAEEISGVYAEATGAKITVEVLMKTIAGRPSSPDSAGYGALSDSIREIMGRPPEPVGISGGTCANFFRLKGFDAYAWQTGDSSMHSPNEYMLVKNLMNDTKVFAALIHKLCMRSLEHPLDHPLGVELDDVVVFLTVADECDGFADGMGYGQCRSALGVGIDLGEDDRIDPHGIVEDLGLLDGVVAGKGVPDEDLEGGFGDPGDLLHLLDEVVVGLHTSCGVDEDNVLVLGPGMLDGIESDRGGVRILGLLDDLASELLRMDAELFDRTCPERVAGGHDDCLILILQTFRYLGDRGGLPGTVDAYEHNDRRFLLLGDPLVEVEFVDLQDIPDRILYGQLHDLFQCVRAVVLLSEEALSHALFDLVRHREGDIRLQEREVEFVEDLVQGRILDLLPAFGDDLCGFPGSRGRGLLLLLELQHLLPGELRLLRFRRWGRFLNGCCRDLRGGLLLLIAEYLLLVQLRIGLAEQSFQFGLERIEHPLSLTASGPAACSCIRPERPRIPLREPAGPPEGRPRSSSAHPLVRRRSLP